MPRKALEIEKKRARRGIAAAQTQHQEHGADDPIEEDDNREPWNVCEPQRRLRCRNSKSRTCAMHDRQSDTCAQIKEPRQQLRLDGAEHGL